MEALIPQLFILTAEASVVLLLILIVVFIFNMKARRKDMKAVNELIKDYTGSREERISSLKKQLHNIGFKGDADEQAEKLFQNEKKVIKEFVTLYLRHDTYRLLDYPDNVMESHNEFLKTSGGGHAAVLTEAPEIPVVETAVDDGSRSEATANATILAREQAEANEAHLKELSELRLKNTELNEHLFEALETITGLMTEHGKKTGQEVESNAQKILEAIIYLRDKRLEHDNDPGKLAPPLDDDDQVASFDLDSIEDDSVAVDLAQNDGTLDDSTAVNLGINDELNIDLDAMEEPQSTAAENQTTAETTEAETVAIDLDKETSAEASNTTEDISSDDDPWGDALAEQASSEAEQVATAETAPPAEPEPPVETQPQAEMETTAEPAEEADPWADALAEQATSEADKPADSSAAEAEEETDPWADALAEQATSEAEQETPETAAAEEADPWADALAEQASAESETEEADPWAEALAEQEKSENK